MTIKELETITGVTKQNIRFYERKGLLAPERNPDNDYRNYVEEDVKRLRFIKIFRMLDMPLEDIKKILNRESPLEELVVVHLNRLTEEEKHLKAAMEVCRMLQDKKLEAVNPAMVLDQMNEMEKQGGKFKRILEDYRKVAAGERRKEFSFVPDNIINNPSDFTEALLRYAKEENINLIITKESMYPVFEIDGLEYTATRTFCYGPVVLCCMTRPEEAEATDVPEKARKKYKWLYRAVGPAVILIALLIMTADRRPTLQSFLAGALVVAGISTLYYCLYFQKY